MKSASQVLATLRQRPRLRKRASYREGVEWIALNDDAGSPDAQVRDVVAGYISTCLLADLFGFARERVAKDVVRYRGKHRTS